MTIPAPDEFVHEEAFNLLCGDKIGEGLCRTVFECKIDPTIVVKVEKEPKYMWQNIAEYRHWDESQFWKAGARWLAPCVSISFYGSVLLQRRVEPLRQRDLPKKLPAFLNRDIKPSHFGWYQGRIVCCDYALAATELPLRLTAAKWE